jgi:hypothetical protein
MGSPIPTASFMSDTNQANRELPEAVAARAKALLDRQELLEEEQRILSDLKKVDDRLQEQIDRTIAGEAESADEKENPQTSG